MMKIDPVTSDRSFIAPPADSEPASLKKSAPAGVAECTDSFLGETPSEKAKNDFSLNQNSPSVVLREKGMAAWQGRVAKLLHNFANIYDRNLQKGQTELEDDLLSYYKAAAPVVSDEASPELKEMIDGINEIIEVFEDDSYDDDFNFEKTMLCFQKLMLKSIKDDAETHQSMIKQFEDELRKIGKKRNKELQKIINRMGRKKWFNALQAAGIAIGGVAGIIALTVASAGTATIVGAAAGAVILTGMGIDKTAGSPTEKLIKDITPDALIDSVKVGMTFVGTLLYSLNKLLVVPMIFDLFSEGGKAVTELQNSYTEKNIEKQKNKAKLRSESIDDLNSHLEFLGNIVKQCHKIMKDTVRNPHIFSDQLR